MRLFYNLIPLGIVLLLCFAFYNTELRRTMTQPMVLTATTGPDQPVHAYEAAREMAQAHFDGQAVEFPSPEEGQSYVERVGNGVYTVSAWARQTNPSGPDAYLPWSARVRCKGQECHASRLQIRS